MTMVSTPALAIYDLDRTITRRPTFPAFLRAWLFRRAPWRLLLLPLTLAPFALFAARIIGRGGLKCWLIALLVGAPRRDRLETMCDRFIERLLASGCSEAALAQIAQDRAQGCVLVMATASMDFYAEALGRRLGFDAVLATPAAWSDAGRLLPRLAGPNCYGMAKLSRILRFLLDNRVTSGEQTPPVRFYSDHVSDLPTFEWSDRPVAVNPDRKLARLARMRAWPIERWI